MRRQLRLQADDQLRPTGSGRRRLLDRDIADRCRGPRAARARRGGRCRGGGRTPRPGGRRVVPRSGKDGRGAVWLPGRGQHRATTTRSTTAGAIASAGGRRMSALAGRPSAGRSRHRRLAALLAVAAIAAGLGTPASQAMTPTPVAPAPPTPASPRGAPVIPPGISSYKDEDL